MGLQCEAVARDICKIRRVATVALGRGGFLGSCRALSKGIPAKIFGQIVIIFVGWFALWCLTPGLLESGLGRIFATDLRTSILVEVSIVIILACTLLALNRRLNSTLFSADRQVLLYSVPLGPCGNSSRKLSSNAAVTPVYRLDGGFGILAGLPDFWVASELSRYSHVSMVGDSGDSASFLARACADNP